ncbi:MAG TPA: amidohydrolase family protein [Capsulimonadaceae bacterium]|jgi:imidazolonepropionase-like amidohydrolase
MAVRIWVTRSYFDGERFFESGPYTIVAEESRITLIEIGDYGTKLQARYAQLTGAAVTVERVPFLMPGLVEGHAHLFLNGAELDVKVRSAYLKADKDEMLAVARDSVRETYCAGVTLVRDAGDIHGINTHIKAECAGQREAPAIRSAGRALRKVKRYGSFMALEAADSEGIVARIDEMAPLADDIKVLMTGIIDFKTGEMVGSPQFEIGEAQLIVNQARTYGKKTFTHCSGLDGLRIAVGAGMDSIEHGFFMTDEILQMMAEKQTAWVPTFSPVVFQRDRPELAGWDADTVGRLSGILDNHYAHLERSYRMGVPIVAGSDAGSYGVPHGSALIDELFHERRAGIPIEGVLASATSIPRRVWGCESANIRVGNGVDMIALHGSPRDNMENLRCVLSVYREPVGVGAAV